MSVILALELLELGLQGPSAAEVAKLLRHPVADDIGRVQQLLCSWPIGAAHDGADDVQLQLASGIFTQRSYPIKPQYLDYAKQRLSATLEQLDFRADPEVARASINRWVADKTQQHIAALLPPGSVQSETRFVLASALYFHGGWQTPFDSRATRPAEFHLADGTTRTIAAMMGVGQFDYAAFDDIEIVDLPYRSGRFSLTFVLPRQSIGLADVEGDLTTERWQQRLTSLKPTQVQVFIPRFKISHAHSVPLRAALEKLGMRHAFSPDADFGRMIEVPQNEPTPRLDEIFHQGTIEVSEQGTEAAAATAAVATRGVAPPAPEVIVRFDRPFLFALRDRFSGMLLFVGRFAVPEQ